jgi:peptide/nickel transport system permease protein
MMFAIALVSWAGFARVVRSLVISIKDAEYMKAAKASGTRGIKLITRHVLPNIAGAILTILFTGLGNTILQIAGFSFLGLGAAPPAAEWGMMINDARIYISGNPSLILYPVAAVTIAVLGFHLIGDGLKDISDSREV